MWSWREGKNHRKMISFITGLPTRLLSWAIRFERESMRSLRSEADAIFTVITPSSTYHSVVKRLMPCPTTCGHNRSAFCSSTAVSMSSCCMKSPIISAIDLALVRFIVLPPPFGWRLGLWHRSLLSSLSSRHSSSRQSRQGECGWCR